MDGAGEREGDVCVASQSFSEDDRRVCVCFLTGLK